MSYSCYSLRVVHHSLLPFLVVDRLFPASVCLCSCQYIGTASAELATSQLDSTSQFYSTSHLPMLSLPSSTAEKGGGSTDEVSSSGESPAPVIVGVLVAVIVAIILLSLVVAAVICYKAKVVKKYNVESDGRSNGEVVL